MLTYFSSLKQFVNRRNIFLVVGAFFIIPLGISSASYMNRTILSGVGIPLWLTILSSSISLLCVLYYIVSYLINNKDNKLLIILSICGVVVISNLVTILIQPNLVESSLLIKMHYLPHYGEYYSFSTEITWDMRLVYFLQFTVIVLYILAAVFILPKTFNDFTVVVAVNYLLLCFFAFTVIFSLFVETEKYGDFIKCLINTRGGISLLPEYAIFSIFSHRNIYAMFLIMVIISNLIVFSLIRKKYYIFIIIFLSLYLFFTYSKSMILITYISLVLFFYIFNIYSFKENKKYKIWLLSIVSGLIVVMTSAFLILYFTNQTMRDIIDPMIKYFGTISTREAIWDTVIEVLNPSWFVTGRGYGITITIINDASQIIIGHEVSHEHSWFFSMLSIGGCLLVCVFIAFLIYLVYSLIKVYKINFLVALSLSFGFVVLFIQSFIENSFYMLFVIALTSELLIYTNKKQLAEQYNK